MVEVVGREGRVGEGDLVSVIIKTCPSSLSFPHCRESCWWNSHIAGEHGQKRPIAPIYSHTHRHIMHIYIESVRESYSERKCCRVLKVPPTLLSETGKARQPAALSAG